MARKRAEEDAFDADLKAYIENDSRFQFGGVFNLLAAIAAICAQKSIHDGDDWEKAANAIEDVANKVDLDYPEE